MKKLIGFIISISVVLCCVIPTAAFADNVPTLTSISFDGATINEEFSSNEFEYTITLNNSNKTPTLKDYQLSALANIFVTYSTDSYNRTNGIIVKVEHDNGASYYNFMYSNPPKIDINGNNLLKSVNCNLGEVYPQINENDTSYRLYIPSDLTELSLSVATDDLFAVADVPSEITLSEDQEPVISITVTASNGDTKEYQLKVKRLSKNSAEILKEMENPNYKSMVYGELFYQKPEFMVGLICVLGGIIFVLLAILVAKRIMVKVGDDDEEEFFE